MWEGNLSEQVLEQFVDTARPFMLASYDEFATHYSVCGAKYLRLQHHYDPDLQIRVEDSLQDKKHVTAQQLVAELGEKVRTDTIGHALKRLGWTRTKRQKQKRTWVAPGAPPPLPTVATVSSVLGQDTALTAEEICSRLGLVADHSNRINVGLIMRELGWFRKRRTASKEYYWSRHAKTYMNLLARVSDMTKNLEVLSMSLFAGVDDPKRIGAALRELGWVRKRSNHNKPTCWVKK